MLLRAAWWGQQHGAALAWLAAGAAPVFTLGGWHVPEGTLMGHGSWQMLCPPPVAPSSQPWCSGGSCSSRGGPEHSAVFLA